MGSEVGFKTKTSNSYYKYIKKLKEILFKEYSNNEQIVNTKRRKLKESNDYYREEKHINGNEKYIVYTQTDLKW